MSRMRYQAIRAGLKARPSHFCPPGMHHHQGVPAGRGDHGPWNVPQTCGRWTGDRSVHTNADGLRLVEYDVMFQMMGPLIADLADITGRPGEDLLDGWQAMRRVVVSAVPRCLVADHHEAGRAMRRLASGLTYDRAPVLEHLYNGVIRPASTAVSMDAAVHAVWPWRPPGTTFSRPTSRTAPGRPGTTDAWRGAGLRLLAQSRSSGHASAVAMLGRARRYLSRHSFYRTAAVLARRRAAFMQVPEYTFETEGLS